MTKTSEDKDLFMQCTERGTMLLSSDGLYNPSMVQKLAAHFMQPEDAFTSQEPGKALFSFYQQAIELAAQFGKLAPHLDKARKGQKPYPMGAIARLAGRLFCLTLHPCVDQGDPKWTALLNDFRQALNVQDPQAVAAVMAAVEWLRTHVLERIRAEARDEDFHVSLEAVNAAKTKLEGIGSTGSAVGMCMGYCAMYFTVLMDGVATGKLTESGKHFSLPREMATSQPDGPLLTTALMFLTVIFGARGGWQEWRTDTKDLGEVLDEFIPADLASGVLMQWDGVTLLPFIPDWFNGKVQPEFVAQMEQAYEAFSSHGHEVRCVALYEPDMQEASDGFYKKDEQAAMFAGFDIRGSDLLSTRGLYRDGMVQAIVKAIPSIPAWEFDNDSPNTTLFNFYLHTIALAQDIDAVSGKLDQARHGGEDAEGNDVTYPMTDVSRIGALLTVLTLHRAVEPFKDNGPMFITRFCESLGIEDTSTVSALCNAVNWLRGMLVQRYRTFIQGSPSSPSRDDINQVRELLADIGQGGDYIGLALGFTIANLLALMAGAESGELVEGIKLPIRLSEEQADSLDDAHILNILLNAARRYFGACGGWKHWPEQDGDLGESLNGAIPADVQGGLLMEWKDATLVPCFWDWYREYANETPQNIMTMRHFYWAKNHQIALAYYALI